nr:MAG TPA: major capsid protein [Caudoviricetes sp.]
MLVDHSLKFSDKQKLTAAAASTNVVDLEEGTSSAGFSKGLEVTAVVTSDVTGTLQVQLQDCDTKSGTFNTVAAGEILTTPKAGMVIQFAMPYKTRRYIRLYYGGAPTAGAVTGFLTVGRQQWRATEQAASLKNATVAETSA